MFIETSRMYGVMIIVVGVEARTEHRVQVATQYNPRLQTRC